MSYLTECRDQVLHDKLANSKKVSLQSTSAIKLEKVEKKGPAWKDVDI